jgi:rhamnosyltransferase subunit B
LDTCRTADLFISHPGAFTGPIVAEKLNLPWLSVALAPESVFVCAYAPNSGLFPRAAAVVHQGGIGTLAEAMSAGVPSLIVPHIHDQHDNAFRAVKLGIARQESPASYRGPRAAAHLRSLLIEPEYRTRAAQVQAHVNQENGVERACAAIETMLNQGRPERKESPS